MYNKNILYRTTGVTLHDLVSTEAKQMDMFGVYDRENKFDLIQSKQSREIQFNNKKKMFYWKTLDNNLMLSFVELN
jgi:hypothetical protein